MATKEQQDVMEFKEFNSLDQFDGFDTSNPSTKEEDDFWNEAPAGDSTDAKEVIKKLEEDEDDSSEEGTEKKTPEEIADELFEDGEDVSDDNEDGEEDDDNGTDGDDEGNDEDDTKSKKTSKASKIDSASTLNFLKDKGLVDFELEEGEELTPELADEILEDKFEEGIESRIEELFGELPQIVKDINKYAMDGGDLNKFFNTVTNKATAKITADIDLGKEENQELIVKEILAQEDNDEEYINTQLEFLKDSGKLKMFAEKKFDKWKKGNEKEQAALVQQQADAKRVQKENLRKYKSSVSKFVTDSEEIGSIKLSRVDKKEIPSYMADKTIKLDNGAVITQRDKDLYEVLQDETASIQLAKLLRSRNKDGSFNFKDIETTVKTKVAKEVKANVRRNKTNTPKKSISQGKSSQNRSLADYF